MKSEALKNIREYMNSEEGEKSIKAFFEKQNSLAHINKYQVEKFYDKYKNNIDEFTSKIIDKYSSKSYKDRWYNRGIEPPEDLYFFLYDIASKYGRKFTKSEYNRTKKSLYFTHDHVYVLGSYCFEKINGQGTAIIVQKYDECF